MKKLVALVLCLIMMVSSAAMAVENSKVEMADGDFFPVSAPPVVVDGTVWVLENEYKVTGEINVALMGWKPGEAKSVQAGAGVLANSDGQTQEESGKDTVHAVSRLFTDGKRLMSLNANTGLLFEIKVDGDKVSFEDIVTLDDLSLCRNQDTDSQVSWKFLFVQDGLLVAGIDTYNPETWDVEVSLKTADMTTGKVKTVNFKLENPEFGCDYKDGKILMTAYTKENPDDENGKYINRVYTIDLETGETQGKWVMDTFSSAIAYHPGKDIVLYMDNHQIRGIKADGQVADFGYAVLDYVEDLTVYDEESVICREYQQLYRVGIEEGWQPGVGLTVAPYYYFASLPEFMVQNPNIAVYFVDDGNVAELMQRMTSGDDSVDVFFVTVGGDKDTFTEYMKKGYYTDLSSDAELMAAVDRMHPVYKNAVTRGNELCGVPVMVYNSGVMGYYPSILRNMDIPEEELPRNLVDLCKFIQYYAEEADESGVYSIYEGGLDNDYKSFLLNLILKQYEDTYQAKGEELTLDTPEFREIMSQWERLNYTPAASDGNWKEGLLAQTSILGTLTSYPFDKETLADYNSMPLGVGLTESSTDWYIPAQITVGMVNPNSKHPEEAKAFLRYTVANLDPSTQYTFYADATEPLDNPEYEEVLEDMAETLADYKAAEEAAKNEDDREFYKLMRESYERDMEEYREKRRYWFNEDQIRYYREEVLPRVFVSKPSELTDTDMLQRLVGGQISVDQFIREMDSKLKMMRLEDQ